MQSAMSRPRVSVFVGLSLDGFIAGPGGDLSWMEPYSTDSPEETGYGHLMDSIDTLIMGRNTYEKVLSFGAWPYPAKRVVVLTRRPLDSRHGEMAYAGLLENLLDRLKRQGSRHVYLDGGESVRQGLAGHLVDEMTLSWVPVILGRGIPLFDAALCPSMWKVKEVRALPSGLVQTVYSRPHAEAAER